MFFYHLIVFLCVFGGGGGGYVSDFRQYVRKPYLLFTTLRNPLELFISGQQFKHRDKTKTLEAATEHCMAAMSSALRYGNAQRMCRVFFNEKFALKSGAHFPRALFYLVYRADTCRRSPGRRE